MKFTATEDIEAPIETVFARVSDFDGFERQALRRGAEVSRRDAGGDPGEDTVWDVAFKLRGRQREAEIKLLSYDPPNALNCGFEMGGLGGTFAIDLIALSRGRTRMNILAELTPRSLSARLMVQSLKLARGNLGQRFSKRVAEFARSVEKKSGAA